MRIQKTRLSFSLITLIFILLTPCLTAASPAIDLSFGFDGQIMRHRFAPFHVQVSGLSEPIDGELIVKQTRGIPGASQAPIIHVIAQGTIANGNYEATLPVSEPLNPISVELVDRNGVILAAHLANPRLGTREWAFPVIVGNPLYVDRTEAIIDSSELPRDWWAYDAAESVWLLTPIVSSPILETLGEWVVSGGSLVLFTGAEFPRMDSPVFRRLLPVSAPTLAQMPDGTYILEGTPKKSATSGNLTRNDKPLLLQMPLGAGTVSLVTVRLEDLAEGDFQLILQEIPPANRMPSIEQITVSTLRSTRVPRPPYWITPVLIVLILTVLLLFSGTAHHLRPRMTLVLLVVTVVSMTVWSGLYANRNNAFITFYHVNTSLDVLSSFGLHIDLRTLYSTQRADIQVEHPDASYALPSALPTAFGVDFAEENEPKSSSFSLQRNERRDLTLFSRGRLDLAMTLTPSGIEVTNRTGSNIHEAYVLVGKETYHIPVLQTGTNTYSPVSSFLSGERSTMVRALQSWLPLREGGAWLILLDQGDGITFEDEGIHQKVRHVAVSLIEGVPQ